MHKKIQKLTKNLQLKSEILINIKDKVNSNEFKFDWKPQFTTIQKVKWVQDIDEKENNLTLQQDFLRANGNSDFQLDMDTYSRNTSMELGDTNR